MQVFILLETNSDYLLSNLLSLCNISGTYWWLFKCKPPLSGANFLGEDRLIQGGMAITLMEFKEADLQYIDKSLTIYIRNTIIYFYETLI